jgi:hypothetical protein
VPESFFISLGDALVDAGVLAGELAGVDAVGVVVCFVFEPPELQALTVRTTAKAPAAQTTLLPVRTVSP